MTANDQLELDYEDLEVDDSAELTGADEQREALSVEPDERKLITQPYDLGVRAIREDIRSGRINLDIAYQRKYVWDLGKASRLIESLLLNVPIPVCYFAEDEEGVYEVIDGLQRLTAIKRFLDGNFAISGASVLSELNGSKFEDLSPKDQRRLEGRTIRCIVITADSHPDIKFDVFERLNTGAMSLTAQELRNLVYRGPFNDSIKELINEHAFTRLLGNTTNKRMGHEELVLRYFAVRNGIEGYQPPLRQLLNVTMRDHRKTAVTDIERAEFIKVCEVVQQAFGDRPFQSQGSQNPVNKALFDAIMVSVAYCNHDELLAKSVEAKTAFDALEEHEQFKLSIGRATADRSRLLHRVAAVTSALLETGVSSTLPAALIAEGMQPRGA
jgi:hypothetical protein